MTIGQQEILSREIIYENLLLRLVVHYILIPANI